MSFFDDAQVYRGYQAHEEEMNMKKEEDLYAPSEPVREENPMFKIERVEFESKELIRLRVNNDRLIVAQNRTHVVRINLEKASDVEDIDVSRRPDDRILDIFQDPTGHHVLISMLGEETIYLNANETRGRNLAKLKGDTITAIGWDVYNSDPKSAGDVLVGTLKGQIYLLSLANEKRPVQPLNHFPDTIRGLHWERISHTGMLFVLVSTSTRLYQYVGANSLDGLFASTQMQPLELGGSLCESGVLSVCPNTAYGPSSRFAWIGGGGLFQGRLRTSFTADLENMIVDAKLCPFDVSKYSQNALGKAITPRVVDVVVSNFHAILLFEHAVQAVNMLTGEVAYDFSFNERVGVLGCISKDNVKESIFLCSSANVFEFIISDEDRDVWKIYAEKKEWELALKYCKGDKEKISVICIAQAEAYLAEGKYELAAINFGKTKASFPEVSLRFIEAKKVDALIFYVGKKVEGMDRKYRTQMTCVCTWLVELCLYRIAHIRGNGPAELLASVLGELRETLKLFVDCLNKRTVMDLIGSYGEIDVLIYFAILTGDYDFAITHFTRTGEYRRALELLGQIGASEERLFYTHSPLLITKLPAQVVDLWIRSKFLRPKKLFPSLVRYNEKVANMLAQQQNEKSNPKPAAQHLTALTEEQIRQMKPMEQYRYFEQMQKRDRGMSDAWVNSDRELRTNQCLRYLRFCVTTLRCTDVAVHNFLLSTFASQDEALLIEFINSNDSHCDLKYALRLCTKLNKKVTCVHIYTRMGLYEEAVDLALQMGDLDLARIPANRPDEFLLKKKLWLRIAQTVIVEKKDVKSLMTFFKECKVLKIEDILPFFPDNVLIRQFKEEILEGLRAYNRDIENLNSRMLTSETTSIYVRKEVLELKNRFGILCFGHPCALCHTPAESKMFLFFPCRHAVHVECLANDDTDSTDRTEKKMKAKEVAKQMLLLQESAEENATAKEKLKALKTNLEDNLLTLCPFCGDEMIATTYLAFIDIVDDDAEIKKWEIED